MPSSLAAEQTGAAAGEMEVPELRALATKYHSEGVDTEMGEAAAAADTAPARAPLMVVNNDNGTKTVLRSTRKAAKASSIIAPAVCVCVCVCAIHISMRRCVNDVCVCVYEVCLCVCVCEHLHHVQKLAQYACTPIFVHSHIHTAYLR